MPSPLDALQALPARGAHFLLCRENKKPYTSAWPQVRPELSAVVAHAHAGGQTGLTARRKVLGAPITVTNTRREGGRHVWYRTPAGKVGHWRTAGWRRENRVAGLCACGRASQPRVNRRFDIDALLSVIPRRRSSEDRHDHCRRVRALAPPGNWAGPVSGFVRVCPAGGTRNAGPHLSPAPAVAYDH